MPLGLVHGSIAALCWGAEDVTASMAGSRLGSLHAVAAARLTSVAAVILLAAGLGASLPADPGTLGLSAAFGVIAAGGYLSLSVALRIGPLAVVSPVVAAYGGLTVLISVVSHGETLTVTQGLGTGLSTLGVILTAIVSEAVGEKPGSSGGACSLRPWRGFSSPP